MTELAKSIPSLLLESNENGIMRLKNTLVVFDGSHITSDSYDIIHKFRNEEGKWAFKWVKKHNNTKQEFMSEYAYDDILSIKNNRLVFMKNGLQGFWYYNTRTEFFFP